MTSSAIGKVSIIQWVDYQREYSQKANNIVVREKSRITLWSEFTNDRGGAKIGAYIAAKRGKAYTVEKRLWRFRDNKKKRGLFWAIGRTRIIKPIFRRNFTPGEGLVLYRFFHLSVRRKQWTKVPENPKGQTAISMKSRCKGGKRKKDARKAWSSAFWGRSMKVEGRPVCHQKSKKGDHQEGGEKGGCKKTGGFI